MQKFSLENHLNKCRCCLALLRPFGHQREITAIEKNNFEILTQIELRISPLLSNKFCASCDMELKLFVKFRSDAIERQQKLSDLIDINSSPVLIKEEPAIDIVDILETNIQTVVIKREESAQKTVKQVSQHTNRSEISDSSNLQAQQVEVQVLIGARDQIILAVDGHIFKRNGRRMPFKNRMLWHCNCDSCPAKLITTKDHEFVELRHCHAEAPDPAKVENLKARQYATKKAIEDTSSRPRDTLNDVIEKFPSVSENGMEGAVVNLIFRGRDRLQKKPSVRN